jgi:hypothetical protein
MRDASADIAVRVWVPCPECRINSPEGVYFLGYDVNMLWCQCALCWHRFWFDSHFGRGGAPERELIWPAA